MISCAIGLSFSYSKAQKISSCMSSRSPEVSWVPTAITRRNGAESHPSTNLPARSAINFCETVVRLFAAQRLRLLSFLIDQLHRLSTKLVVSIQRVEYLAVGFSAHTFLGEGFINFCACFLLDDLRFLLPLSFAKTRFIGIAYFLELYIDANKGFELSWIDLRLLVRYLLGDDRVCNW